MTGELAGTYHSLAYLSEEQAIDLSGDHTLFQRGDRLVGYQCLL